MDSVRSEVGVLSSGLGRPLIPVPKSYNPHTWLSQQANVNYNVSFFVSFFSAFKKLQGKGEREV